MWSQCFHMFFFYQKEFMNMLYYCHFVATTRIQEVHHQNFIKFSPLIKTQVIGGFDLDG